MEEKDIKFKKLTKQRKYIMEVLENSIEPIKVEDIYSKIKLKHELNLVLSTIYRNLDVLVNENRVIKIFSNDGVSTYIINNSKEHKHKLTCIKCKKQIIVDGCPLENYAKKLEKDNVFTIKEHNIIINGYCKNCV